MIAFLKRRWFLLSCALVLLACSMIETRWIYNPNGGFYISNGYVAAAYNASHVMASIEDHAFLHAPAFGGMPFLLIIPLWLPLSIVIGWGTFRELRWSEKQARKAEQA